MKSLSLLRNLEYGELAKIEINGDILDIGGSKKSGYHELIKGAHNIVVANIDEKYDIDFNFDAEKKFPLPDGSYDAVLCLNVLEHLFNFKNAIEESFRVLKKGGRFVGAAPFLFNVHGSPNDYFRYTKSALERIFKESGFRDVEIRELGSGLFSVIYQLKFGLFKFNSIRKFFMIFYPIGDKITKFIKPGNFLTEKNMPLGYFFIAKK